MRRANHEPRNEIAPRCPKGGYHLFTVAITLTTIIDIPQRDSDDRPATPIRRTACPAAVATGLTVEGVAGLTVEGVAGTLGIDTPVPRLSWLVSPSQRGVVQPLAVLASNHVLWPLAMARVSDDDRISGPAVLQKCHRHQFRDLMTKSPNIGVTGIT